MQASTAPPSPLNNLKPRDPCEHTLSVMGFPVIPVRPPKHLLPVFWLYIFLKNKYNKTFYLQEMLVNTALLNFGNIFIFSLLYLHPCLSLSLSPILFFYFSSLSILYLPLLWKKILSDLV